MLDGITPPENMPRYIAHNVTVGMFWSGMNSYSSKGGLGREED